MNEFLPIGTAVTLSNNGFAIDAMILGHMTQDNETGIAYDYIGIAYPIGLGLGNTVFPFNRSDITNIIFIGYENEEGKKWLNALNDIKD